MTVTSAPRKPEGWYASKEKRAKYIHFFKNVEGCTKPLCGKRARQDHRSTYPLPPDSHYAVCPDCLYWYQNLHHAKEAKRNLSEGMIMKTTYLNPPAIIRIPENVTIKDDLVYLGEMVVGYIDLLTPKGMMNIPGPMVIMMVKKVT